MVQRRDLNKPPARQLADIVAGLKDKQDQQRTGSHGVKDMGPGGNIVWSRPDAPEFEVSIRDIDGDLQAAQGRIDEAKADSAEALDRATEAKTDADAAQAGLTELETVTLPGAVADLEAADQAAQAELSTLDGRLAGAQSDLDAAQTSIGGLRTDLDAESQARAQLATDMQGDMSDLNSNLAALDGVVAGKPDYDDLTVGNLVAGTVATPEAVIGKLWADGIMAKSVASSAITVSPGNLLPDPNGNTSVGRTAYANLGFEWSAADTGWAKTTNLAGSNQTKPNAGGDYVSYPLEGGRTYRLAFEAKVEGGTGGARYAIYYTRRDGSTAFVGDQVEGPGGDTEAYTPVPADTWTPVNRTWVCPEDAVAGGFALQVNNVTAGATRVVIRNPFAGVKAGAVMIENGAISADKINAESVAGAVGEFLEISTDQLTAGAASVGSAVAQRLWADIATFNTVTADEVVVGGVGSDALADGAVGAVKIADGAITTPKLTVTEDMSANIVNAMSLESKKLVVTDEAILNHATLIGDTVVEDINVTGKLVGTNGVFTGTVDFENVNVTGLQLVEKLEANSISADKIEGGAFTGESFTGGTFTGGLFKTSDALPGQVQLSDDGYVTHLDGGGTWPGIRVTPIDTTSMEYPAGIGPVTHGVTIYGGKRTGTGSSIVQANTDESFLRTFLADGSRGGEIQTSETASFLRTYRADGGVGGEVQTSGADSFMRTTAQDGAWGAVTVNPTSVDMWTSPGSGSARGYMQANLNDITAASIDDTGRYGWMKATPGGTELAYVASDNTYFSRVKADSQEAFLYTRAGGSGKYIRINSTGMHLEAAGEVTGAFTMRSNASLSGALYYYGAPETSSDPNVFVSSSGGALARSTSSRRYKRNIADWSPDAEAVLGLQPRTWQSKDPDGIDGTEWFVGFIAEEVDDLGLDGLVVYSDDEDGNPRPEALNYTRFSAAQQVVLQKHEQEIQTLKAENAALVARLEALEAKLA